MAAAGLLLCAGTAAGANRTPGPDASKMTLQATDFPGARATGVSLRGSGSIEAGYENLIRLAAPYGTSHYGLVDSIAIVASDLRAGEHVYHVLGHEFSTKAGRLALVRNFLGVAGIKVPESAAAMITPRALHVDDSSMESGFVVRIGSHRLNMSITLIRLDRVVDADIAIGSGTRVALEDGLALTKLAASHIASGLVPVGLIAPLVTGTVARGQTLTASAGAWKGSPESFGYQWQRCDAAGGNCVDVPGATSVIYRVDTADAGSTLRVDVTASSRFGSGMEPSAATAVVT